MTLRQAAKKAKSKLGSEAITTLSDKGKKLTTYDITLAHEKVFYVVTK
jgi:hypothetical protein